MFEQKYESHIQQVCDPPLSRHRPSSEKTQDISHFLGNIYKYIYTSDVTSKEAVNKLKKSGRGNNSYHDKYLDDLEQAHVLYSQRLRDTDALEEHIIQARVRADAVEEFARSNLLADFGEAYNDLGLPPVKSGFRWCVDGSLLKSNNLICPEDYTMGQAPLIKAPKGKRTPGFANPTVSYNMHICKLPKDDGYRVSQNADGATTEMPGSEGTLTVPSSPEFNASSNKISGKTRRAADLNWSCRAEDQETLLRLGQRSNFLRNPRFLAPGASRGGKSLRRLAEDVGKTPGWTYAAGEQSKQVQLAASLSSYAAISVSVNTNHVTDSVPNEANLVFLASPPSVVFSYYRVGQVYESTVELRNVTAASRHIRVIPPATSHFTVSLGKFPGEGSVVAPGMSCHYTVLFAPDSLADFEDCLLVETQEPLPLVIPIKARRPPPVLTLPRVLNCGYCLVGGAKIVEFQCRNVGLSRGTFCIMPKRLWPASSLRSVVMASFAEQPPFGVSPSLFELHPGQDTLVEVAFFPMAAENFSEVFKIVCDNCQVRDITIQGTGQDVALQLVSVTGGEEQPVPGELCDLTAEHLIRFGPANPQSMLKKQLVIRNDVHLALPFHWLIMKPNLKPHLPGRCAGPSGVEYHIATNTVFDISPRAGQLNPYQDHQFQLTYYPEKLKDYHSVLHLVLRDIPDSPKEHVTNGMLHHLERAANVNDIVVMEIEVKGSTEPHQVLLEPYAIHFPGETYVGTAIRKGFKVLGLLCSDGTNLDRIVDRKSPDGLSFFPLANLFNLWALIGLNQMWNNSKSGIRFQWDCVNESHIVEVQPPVGEIGVGKCCDLELMLMGRKPGPLECRLPCLIEHHHLPTVLAVQAIFKGPKLTISVPSLDFGLVRLGELVRSSVVVDNGTPLEASWTLLDCCGKSDAGDTQVTVEPCAGILSPLASCEVTVLFRPAASQRFETVLELAVENGTGCHLLVQADVQSPQACLLSPLLVFSELFVGVMAKGAATLLNQTLLPVRFSWEETELTEVMAVCQVEGMQELLVLDIFSKAKKLEVFYSLPDWPESEKQQPSKLVLDFGGDITLKRAVTKRLTITNLTAIPTSFTVEAEYFTASHIPSPPTDEASLLGRRTSYSRRPLHPLHARKMEAKAQEEFVGRLLAQGKGAAFYIQPPAGKLGPYQTQTVEVTAFTNMWGQYWDHLICKVGDLEPMSIPVTMTVRGCPLYFQLTGPQPDDQTRGPVVRFGTHVSGGDTVSRSLRINNTSPFNIRLDWETFNVERGDRKLLDLVLTYGDAFPLKDTDGNEVLGGCFGSGSDTPTSGGVSQASEEEEEDKEVEKCQPDQQSKLISVHVRIHEGDASDYPFCITPQQMVVPAGGSSTIHVSFTPLTLSGPAGDSACLGFGLGFMSLDSKGASCIPGKVERHQGLQLEPLRLDLQAGVKAAHLCIETEEEETLEFCCVASELLSRDPDPGVAGLTMMTRNMRLRNTLEMPLYFRLSVQPPFFVLPPQLRDGTKSPCSQPGEPPYLVLQPQRSMQVEVAFCGSLSLLTALALPTAQLICSETWGRSLQFQQSLLVEYSNGSVQTVPLCGFLALPTLHLMSDHLDFGTCYVGQACVKEVILCNRGRSSSHWTATIEATEGDISFAVSPSHGVLKPELPLFSCRCPLQIYFTARDTQEVRATVTVHGILGELPVSLQVRAKGSLDEAYMTVD